MVSFGKPADLPDDEVREGKSFWEGKLQEFTRKGEQDGVSTARAAVEEFTAEAEKRGLL